LGRQISLIQKNISRANAIEPSRIACRDHHGGNGFRRPQNRRARNARIRSIHLIERSVEQQNSGSRNYCLREGDAKDLSRVERSDALLSVISKQHPIDR